MGKKSKHENWKNVVWVQPFAWSIMLVTPSSFARFVKHMKHHKCKKTFIDQCRENMDHVKHRGGACFYSDDAGNYIMFLDDEYKEEHVWHECLHAAIAMWESAGAKLKMKHNEEVLTYTQGYIVRLVKAQLYSEDE